MTNIYLESKLREDRLKTAIIMSAFYDFNKYSKQLKTFKKNSHPRILHELQLIANFIMSDWFNCLTNGKCPQKDCLLELVNKNIINKEYKNFILKKVRSKLK